MEFRIERVDVRSLKVFGEVDIAVAAEFESSLLSSMESTGDLVVDLSGLTFIDSTGLRSLLVVSKALGERGDNLILVQVPASVARLLDILGAGEWPNVTVAS